MVASPVPDLAEVFAARRRIEPYLKPTPLYRYPALDALTGARLWVKHENHQPVGAFKVRGGVNLVSQLSADERRRGVIAASTGNHGQSVAYAADLFGVRAVICMPERANPVKVGSMQALGAEVAFRGRDFDEAREYCEELAAGDGYRYIHSGNEPALIAGVATCTLELIEARPDVEVIVVPVGGGSGAAAACVVAKAVRPSITVIGVQSAAAPAAYRSWRAGSLVQDTTSTFAEGAGDQDRVRAAAADHAGAARRLRPGLRGCAAEREPVDDREDPQPGRAGRRGPAGRRAQRTRPVRRPPGGPGLQRRQHQPSPAGRAVTWRNGMTADKDGARP
jgi:threonine dehydratase